MSARRFWLWISVATGVLWGVLGLVFDGIVGGVALGAVSFLATLFMGGMVCAGAERQGGSDDETLEM